MNVVLYNTFLSVPFLMGFSRVPDIILPTWVFWVFPISWPFIIPIGIILYSIVMWLFMLYLKIDKPLKAIKKTIIKVSFFGFLCDLIVVGFLSLITFGGRVINHTSDLYYWYKDVFLKYLQINPFDNIFVLLTICSAILLSRVINYKLNKRYSFSKLDTDEETKKKLALYMAIFTAPYIFFFSVTI